MADNTQVQTESTNLAVVEETSFGAQTPPDEGWRNLQPNSYGTFGPSYKKTPRDPISKNAQLQKGMLTDLDSGISIETDIDKDNIDRFAAAAFRCVPKHSSNEGETFYKVEAVTGTGYTVAELGALNERFLVVARGLAVDDNNGLKLVGAGSTSTEIKTSGLDAETSPPANATVEVCGYRGTTGNIQLNSDGDLTSSGGIDFTTWGLSPFQWISIGDPNESDHSFATPDFIGSARIRKVEATKLTLDRRNWVAQQKAYLDLGTLATNLDTVVEAQLAGSAGNSITVTAVDDGDPAVKATLDLDTPTANVDTVIRAKVAGLNGNDITVEITDGAPTAAGTLTEVGENVLIAIKITATATTVADLEALIATSTLIEVDTAGTPATLDAGDLFSATPLTGGLDADPVSVTEISTAVTIHFTGGASTVAEVEQAITDLDSLLEVKTAGTGNAVLVNTADEFGPSPLAHGAEGTDSGAGKTIDVYFGRWYRNVATDHADYATPSFAFEVTYQTLNAGAPEYEYLLGNMLDEVVWNLNVASKATMSLKFVGTKTMNPTADRMDGPADALDPNTNLGLSTSTDLLRLRIVDHDETGISTDFQSLKITASNGVSPEKQLGELGAKFMNVGKHKEMIEAACIFTNDLVIKSVKDNRTCSLDVMMRNGDFGALYDVQSMTMDSADRKLERDKSVIIDNKASGFQDQFSGSTASLSVFPYLPPLVADDE